MFQTPALIGMSIAATRMYRSLTDFTSSSGYYVFSSPLCPHAESRQSRRAIHTYATRNMTNINPKRMFASPIPLGRVEVAVHTNSEGYPPADIGQYVSYGPESDSQSQDEHRVPSTGSDLENGVKRG